MGQLDSVVAGAGQLGHWENGAEGQRDSATIGQWDIVAGDCESAGTMGSGTMEEWEQ